nr:immunoglobulin light chain junction region [Macaca mulatta]
DYYCSVWDSSLTILF